MALPETEKLAPPQHIAIIMDGNGRWAKKRGLPRTAGHAAGAESFRTIANYCRTLGVKYLTVYAFSTENWSRPKTEVNKIFQILNDYLIENQQKLLDRDAKLLVLGDESALPKKLQKTINSVRASTSSCTKRAFCLALNYGGRSEIVRAVNTLLSEGVKAVTEQDFARYLYTSTLPDPELIVRTGGKQRLSNFLLYQCAYSEFYFTDILWPDFDGEALKEAVAWYHGVTRNFGGIPIEEDAQ